SSFRTCANSCARASSTSVSAQQAARDGTRTTGRIQPHVMGTAISAETYTRVGRRSPMRDCAAGIERDTTDGSPSAAAARRRSPRSRINSESSGSAARSTPKQYAPVAMASSKPPGAGDAPAVLIWTRPSATSGAETTAGNIQAVHSDGAARPASTSSSMTIVARHNETRVSAAALRSVNAAAAASVSGTRLNSDALYIALATRTLSAWIAPVIGSLLRGAQPAHERLNFRALRGGQRAIGLVEQRGERRGPGTAKEGADQVAHGRPLRHRVRRRGMVNVARPLLHVREVPLCLENAQQRSDGRLTWGVGQRGVDVGCARLSAGVDDVHDLPLATAELLTLRLCHEDNFLSLTRKSRGTGELDPAIKGDGGV